MIQAHPLGILLGITFVSAIGLLFHWMFRVPPVMSLPAVQVHRSVASVHRIMVPIIGAIPSARAVEMACRFGHAPDLELLLVHVIVVPFTMALNAPSAEWDRIAKEAVKLGSVIAQRYGCPARQRIIRDRNAVDGILRIAREENVDAIILGVGSKEHVPGEWDKTSTEILRRATCEVIVDKVPMKEQPLATAA